MPLSPPPLDDNGNVHPHDHTDIEPGDGVLRGISEHFLVTATNGQRRISSMAFQSSSGNTGMSVNLQRLIEEANIDPQDYMKATSWVGAVRFTAGALRKEKLQVGFHPLENNPYHGEVWGDFTKSKQRKLQKLAVWFVEIPDVTI